MPTLRWLVFALILSVIAPSARAADLSLPLAGYYHPGRYMPVRFSGTGTGILLGERGSIITQIPRPSSTGGIAPFLIYQTGVSELPDSQPLHELTPEQRLIGVTGDGPDIGPILFPQQPTISVSLDPLRPLPGPAAAWQSLDAVVLDPASAVTLTDEAKQTLLAGGTTLACRAPGTSAPDAKLPWQRLGQFWIVRSPQDAAGLTALANDWIEQPASGWAPGRSRGYRLSIVRFGLLATIAIIGLALFRPAPTDTALLSRLISLTLPIFVSIVAMAIVLVWDSVQPTVASAVGVVHLATNPAEMDTWLFQRSERVCLATVPFAGMTLPMLPQHGGPGQMTLICDTLGNPLMFTCQLRPDSLSAFVYRSISFGQQPYLVDKTITSPLRFLPPSVYAGFSAIGEGPAGPPEGDDVTQWPALLLARSDAIPK